MWYLTAYAQCHACETGRRTRCAHLRAQQQTRHSTTAGEKIIRQAEKALAEAERITELVAEDKGAINGELALSVGPTIAPYILPKFIRHYMESYPTVKLSIREMKADVMLSELLLGHLDAGIAISGNTRQGILEVPLYTERFMVYLSESCWRKLPVFKPENLEHEKMWIMKEAQCLRESAFSFCKPEFGVVKSYFVCSDKGHTLPADKMPACRVEVDAAVIN